MKSRIFALALAAAAIPAAAQAMTFSAIALSPATGAFGYSFDQRSQGAANAVALGNCRERSGAPRDCRVVQWTRGPYCAALVINHTRSSAVGWGTGSAPGEGEAKRIAWRQCQANNNGRCDEVAATVCSH